MHGLGRARFEMRSDLNKFDESKNSAFDEAVFSVLKTAHQCPVLRSLSSSTGMHELRQEVLVFRTLSTFEVRPVRRRRSPDRSSEPSRTFPSSWILPTRPGVLDVGQISAEPNFFVFEFSNALNITVAVFLVSSTVVFEEVRIFTFFETPGKKDAASPVS